MKILWWTVIKSHLVARPSNAPYGRPLIYSCVGMRQSSQRAPFLFNPLWMAKITSRPNPNIIPFESSFSSYHVQLDIPLSHKRPPTHFSNDSSKPLSPYKIINKIIAFQVLVQRFPITFLVNFLFIYFFYEILFSTLTLKRWCVDVFLVTLKFIYFSISLIWCII